MPRDTFIPNSSTTQATAPYVDTQQFAAIVEQARGLAIVDFTADRCPPCRMLAPHIDALAREFAERTLTISRASFHGSAR